MSDSSLQFCEVGQWSIYLDPRESRQSRQPWLTLRRKITMHYRATFTQSQHQRTTWQMSQGKSFCKQKYIQKTVEGEWVWGDYSAPSTLHSGTGRPLGRFLRHFPFPAVPCPLASLSDGVRGEYRRKGCIYDSCGQGFVGAACLNNVSYPRALPA